MYYIALLFFLASLVLLVTFNYYQARIFGKIAELFVAKKYLSKLSDEYKIYNNLLVKTKDNNTHQIDHVIVSSFGIFIVETKGYLGKVYGSQYTKKWTEYYFGHGYPFYNPIRQNYGHIQAFMELTDLPKEAFISVVVFARDATLKVSIKNKNRGCVVQTPQLLEIIASYKRTLISSEIQKRVRR